MLGSVPELCEKLVVGQDSLAEAEEYMSCLEDSINVTFGDKTIRQWRAEHDDWERRVVDVSEHASLANPFNVPSDASAYPACIRCASLSSLGQNLAHRRSRSIFVRSTAPQGTKAGSRLWMPFERL